jgi:hypothetical protein
MLLVDHRRLDVLVPQQFLNSESGHCPSNGPTQPNWTPNNKTARL